MQLHLQRLQFGLDQLGLQLRGGELAGAEAPVMFHGVTHAQHYAVEQAIGNGPHHEGTQRPRQQRRHASRGRHSQRGDVGELQIHAEHHAQ